MVKARVDGAAVRCQRLQGITDFLLWDLVIRQGHVGWDLEASKTRCCSPPDPDTSSSVMRFG